MSLLSIILGKIFSTRSHEPPSGEVIEEIEKEIKQLRMNLSMAMKPKKRSHVRNNDMKKIHEFDAAIRKKTKERFKKLQANMQLMNVQRKDLDSEYQEEYDKLIELIELKKKVYSTTA